MARANAAQQLLSNLGLHARPDYSNHDRYHLRHTGDLDALREAALEEGPGSVSYARWMAALQNGDDEGLADVDTFSGAIPMARGAQAGEMERAIVQGRQQWIPDRIDPRLHQYGWEGVAFSQMEPDTVRTIAHAQLAEALPHERGDWLQVLEAVDNSHTSSMGVEWSGDGSEQLSFTTASEQNSGHSDPYTQWREATQNLQGLQRLNIQHASSEEQLLSGVAPDGLSYSQADDWAAAINTAGDDANTFTDAI